MSNSSIKIKTDYYNYEHDELLNYKIDQSTIIQKKYLQYVQRLKYKEENLEPLSNDIDWYPLINSYYQFTEDVDAYSRVNHLLENKTDFNPYHNERKFTKNYYSEKETQLHYLQTKPISFLILGKPNIGQDDLGKQLAEYWKCIYIDPELVIEEEIESGSRTGHCIEFNLRCGRAIGVDIILRLVERRIKEEVVRHRGFVLCGFPLIRNDLFEEDPISSESAIFNVQDIFEEIIDAVLTFDVQNIQRNVSIISSKAGKSAEEESVPSAAAAAAAAIEVKEELEESTKPLIVSQQSGGNIKNLNDYNEQINYLFNLFEKPFMVVYVVYETLEVIEKRSKYRFDVYSQQFINPQLYQNFTNKTDGFRNALLNLQYLVRLPEHFPANVQTQLSQYHDCMVNFIEQHIMLHDQQYYVKVDGRTSIIQMLNIIKARLKVLPVQQVLLAQRFSDDLEPIMGEGDSPRADDNVGDDNNLTIDEIFMKLSKQQNPSPLFKWTWSDWGIKCPVSLKEGGYKDGNSKYAVHFMNKLYFLNDEESCIKFQLNPRPYLLPPFPKSNCRIFIFGPPGSGRTTLAECLSYLFNGTILSPTAIEEKYLNNKMKELKEIVRQTAQIEALNLLNKHRITEAKRLNEERLYKIDRWKEKCLNLLTSLYDNYQVKHSSLDLAKFSSFRFQVVPIGSSKKLTIDERQVISLNKQLNENNLPAIQTIEECVQFLDPNYLIKYLPIELLNKIEAIPATIFDDFVIDYVRKAEDEVTLDTIEIDEENIFQMYISAMKEIEENYMKQYNCKGGWIIDGMSTQIELIHYLSPEYLADEIILLKDNSDNYEFLLSNFISGRPIESVDLRSFFQRIGKIDAAWRTPSTISTPSYKKRLVEDILQDVIDYTNLFEDNTRITTNQIEIYRSKLASFIDEWELIKDSLTTEGLIEVEVNGKSLEDLLEEVIDRIDDRYRQNASIFNETDRSEEIQDFRNFILDKVGSEGDSGDKNYENELFYATRRYGDTLNYCPVTFHDNWVLWKGKEDFSVKFLDKIYLLSNQEDMEKFLITPRKYLLGNQSPEEFPPPRVCVIGCEGSGKTTIAKLLARNLGVRYVSYENLLMEQKDLGGEGINGLIENYLNSSTEPLLLHDLFKQIIPPLWFDEPIRNYGFVLDDFPRQSTDVEFMVNTKTIPDIILDMSVSQEIVVDRLLVKKLAIWRRELEEKKSLRQLEKRQIIMDWEEKKEIRFNELMEIQREKRFLAQLDEKFNEMEGEELILQETPKTKSNLPPDEVANLEISGIKSTSQVSFNSVAEMEDYEEVSKIVDEEFPEPQFVEDIWETTEEATERLYSLIVENYLKQIGYMDSIQELCSDQLIQFIKLDGNLQLEKTEAQSYIVTDSIKFRNNSLFERCFTISVEIAERLLIEGYYFLSEFGKTCPVQYYEHKIPIQLYIPSEYKFNLYPIIHRYYIYFLAGTENRDKFKQNPLKYVNNTNKIEINLIPYRIAIIGPPKSGKSSLAERYNSDFGLKLITRGKAARFVLRNLSSTNLGRRMEKILRKGSLLTDEMTMRSVQALTFDSKAVTQGIIFDGFPQTVVEMKYLSSLGLVPHLIIELAATEVEVNNFLTTCNPSHPPLYSQRFFSHILECYNEKAEDFMQWYNSELQLIKKIQTTTSLWCIWVNSIGICREILFEIHLYYLNCHLGVALRLSCMQVTPLELLERQSSYKTYCPYCLYYSNVLRNAGKPLKRPGLLQYLKFIYWLCYEHIEDFLKKPDDFILLYDQNVLPKDLPEYVILKEMPENVYEDGLCVVCYLNNLPKRMLVDGDIKFAAKYIEKIYLFDCVECLEIFMETPTTYSVVVINFKKSGDYPALKYQDLPTQGMLQQYVAERLIKALNNTHIYRPIIPGLSITNSALMNVGLHLKLWNPLTPKEYLPSYEEAQQLAVTKRNCLIHFLGQIKKLLNPLLHYEQPPLCFIDFTPSTPSMISIFDELLNRIDYDKTSMLSFIDEILNRINYHDDSGG